MPMTTAADGEPYQCACGRIVAEWLWVVKNEWFCSEACGSNAARHAKLDSTQPQSQARYPAITGSGLL